MPALLAYLLSIAIFIGGGYVGLVWLTNPPTDGTVQSASFQVKKSEVPTKETKRRAADAAAGTSEAAVKPVDNELGSAIFSGPHVTDRNIALKPPGEKFGAEAKPADTGLSAAEHSVSKQLNVPDAPSGQTQIARAENAPSEGCMAIGVTARGQLVFPMQCRDVLGNEREASREVRQSTGEPKTQSGSLAPTAPVTHDTATKTEPAKPLTGLNQNLSPSTSPLAEKSKSSPETVSKAETKPVPEKAEKPQAIEENRGESPKRPRSKPIMMILRTIEFPDGHREQRLLPINRTPKTASQSEESWFSPLSYR